MSAVRSVIRVGTRLAVPALTGLAVAAIQTPASTMASAGSNGLTPAAATAAPVPGYRQVSDDTGTITVSIPVTWTVTNTTPLEGINADGIRRPRIEAAGPDALLQFWADPYRGPVQPWDGSCDPAPGECAALLTSEPYDDGMFVGTRQLVEECCGGGLLDHVEAVAYDRSFTAQLFFSYGDHQEPAEVAIFETILATFMPAAAAPPTSAVFPFGAFHAVPQLGTEPVRGSGCGSQGQIGEQMPDGVWAGYARVADGAVEIDLLCVYMPPAAAGVLAEGTATIVHDDPEYLVVNNNPQVRYVPAASSLQLRDGVTDEAGACVEGPQRTDHRASSDHQAWVNISGGVATWVLWGCEAFAPAPAALPAGAPLPPAWPDYSDGVGHVWPYGEFWNVPQLGSEPARGSGCGAEGQVGAQIPDGLWAGYVVSFDGARNGFWIDLLCIFSGSTAQAVVAEGTANIVSDDPDYLVVNNNPQTRFVPSVLAAFIFGEVDDSGRCVEGPHWSPEEVGIVDSQRQGQAWIRIDGGHVTWIFYGCG